MEKKELEFKKGVRRMGLLHDICHPIKAYKNYLAQEKRITRPNGEDPETTYYVIRCNLPECGFFAIYMYILDHLAWAEDHGYVPVLDIERYDCLYKEKEPVNDTTNPWYYYFQPLSEVTLEDCKRKKNVIYGPIKYLHYKAIYYYRDKEKNVLPDSEQISELHKLAEKYMKLRPEIKELLDEQKKLISCYGRVLGIHVRGTDMYTEGKQHPIPTGKTKDFSLIDDIIKTHHIEGIFLCTDTESTVQLFREKYGDKVITTDAVRQVNDNGTGIHKDKALGDQRLHHKYLLGVEVLTDMYMLANCQVLLCGPSNVPFTALIYNDNEYEKVYYFV